MAGAGLLDIKRRIKSVRNTKKITKAMGLVATSKLRKARTQLNSNSAYYENMKSVFDLLTNKIEDIGNTVYVKGNNSNRKLYIVISSDTGLCGGFNAGIANYLYNNYKDNTDNVSTIVVGKKGISYVKKYQFETLAEYVDIGDNPTTKEASMITNKILSEFSNGNFGEVSIIYTKFLSQVTQEIVEERLLPLQVSNGVSDKVNYNIEYDESALDIVVSSYLKSNIIHAIFHSQTSEQSARMQAMDGASKNADDILNALNIKYNRIRQSIITQEISEIVGGAEAQR